jgi:hypothetical protein
MTPTQILNLCAQHAVSSVKASVKQAPKSPSQHAPPQKPELPAGQQTAVESIESNVLECEHAR